MSINRYELSYNHYRFALRQRLLPCIEATYGDGAHRNLASLAIASDALHDEVIIVADRWIIQSKEQKRKRVVVEKLILRE